MKIFLNKSIKAKLFGLIIFFLLVPFLMFSYIWSKESSEILEQNAIDYSMELVQQQNRYLDYYFENLERATLPLVTHPLIQEFISLDPEDDFNQFRVSKEIEEEVLPELIGRGDISSFHIVSENGGSTSSKNFDSFQLYRYQDAPKILGFRLRGVHHIYTMTTPTIRLTRPFLDTTTYGVEGMMIVDLKINHLKRIADQTRLGESGFIWVADQSGSVLFHPDMNKIGREMDAGYFKEVKGSERGYFIKEIDGEKKLVTYHRSSITNLLILSEVPLSEVIGNLANIKELTILIGILLIVTAIVLIGGYSFSLTRSLTELQKLMQETERGNLRVRAREDRGDEVGKVNRSFNKMVKELQRSIEVVHRAELTKKEMEIKQQKSMLKAMQSQINPHFLYNTLELINSHAIVDGNGTISRMAYSLADMFRYNVSNQNQFVSLKEEIDHVKSYLEIQKERYPELEVTLDFNDNDLKVVSALRLILQPLIENVFEHGYERAGVVPSILKLKGRIFDQGYCVDITDHGVGMPAETKAKYNQAFRTDGKELVINSDIESKIDRIGLWNVHSRIRLTFGDSYGLSIIKSNNGGTTIRMVLPKKTTEGESECFVS